MSQPTKSGNGVGLGMTLRVEGNGYTGRMSAEAAGITTCLLTFSHLSLRINDELIIDHYSQLPDFALEQPEAGAILRPSTELRWQRSSSPGAAVALGLLSLCSHVG